jgi:hypothetical protein
MLNILTVLMFCRQFIKKNFGDKDYHSIYRSIYCLFITIFSFIQTSFNWIELKQFPMLSASYSSLLINNFMFVYMIYDIWYFFYSKKIRYDLLLHHILCMIIFYNYKNYFIMTYGSLAEIISAMNWLSLINKKYNYFTRMFRIFSIIFIRLPLWINIIFLYINTVYNLKVLYIMSIFILLDIYWLKIMHNNINENHNYYKKINKSSSLEEKIDKQKIENIKKGFFISSSETSK